MADDFDVQTINDGVGKFHFNRFRVCFKLPSPIAKRNLVTDLILNFPRYVGSHYAHMERSLNHPYNGMASLHFHGYLWVLGMDLGAPHSDWVGVEWLDRSVGFTVVTLKRNFVDAAEDGMAGAGGSIGGGIISPFVPVIGPILPALGANKAIELNRMHFLAGRRSWRIDDASAFGIPGDDLMVFETVAVERFSSEVINTSDSIANLETRLPDVWISLLNNFMDFQSGQIQNPDLRPRWVRKRNVDYIQLSFESIVGLLAEPECQNVLRLYPSIMP